MEPRSAENGLGRIEIAPEVLALIAHRTTVHFDGILGMATIPADVHDILRRNRRQNGIVLDISNNKVNFDIYVIMEANVNIMDTSRRLQTAVAQAIDQLVGISVETINVHVEDIQYPQGEHL